MPFTTFKQLILAPCLLLVLPVLLVLLNGCAGKDDKKGDEVVKADEGSFSEDKRETTSSLSAERNTFTNSWSNNPLTSQTINAAKADALVEQLPINSKDKRTLEGRLSAERLGKKSTAAALGTAKRIAEIEMEKGAERSVSDEVKLDLALAALNSKNFGLGEYYLIELFDSKNTRIKAAAYNAVGVVALRDGRVPEAAAYFKEALKANSNYKPALLNLGFAALKGGDLETAKKALSSMQDDWFVQYGLITIARLEGQDGRVDELCDRVLKKEPNHKAVLFNCALHEYQSKRNFAKARDMLEKSGKARGGDPSWDEKAYRLIAEINFDESAARQDAAKQKAAEAARDKAEKEAAARDEAAAREIEAKEAAGASGQTPPAGTSGSSGSNQ